MTARRILLLLFASLLGPAAAFPEVALVYRERTGPQEVRIEISETAVFDGALLEAAMSSGESYRIENDPYVVSATCTFAFPPDGTAWTAWREGDTLRLEGTVHGRSVSRTFTIDEHPWYQSPERSLQSFAVSGTDQPIRFWLIQPYEGRAYLLAGRIDRRETVEVDGRMVEAVRVTVRPTGILALAWSCAYWFDPVNGTFLRSKSVRTLARAPTVMELVEDRRAER